MQTSAPGCGSSAAVESCTAWDMPVSQNSRGWASWRVGGGFATSWNSSRQGAEHQSRCPNSREGSGRLAHHQMVEVALLSAGDLNRQRGPAIGPGHTTGFLVKQNASKTQAAIRVTDQKNLVGSTRPAARGRGRLRSSPEGEIRAELELQSTPASHVHAPGNENEL